MKITFVLPHAGLAGGIRVVAIYAEQLKKRGHEVCVLSLPLKPISLRTQLKSLLKGQGWIASHPSLSHFDNRDVKHHVIERVRPITDADVPDADVVIATWWETAEWVANFSAAKGAKAYFIQHYEILDGQPKERVQDTWCLPIHKIAVAQWLVDIGRTQFGDKHISLVPNSVDAEQFHALPRGRQSVPTVGMLYSTVKWKGCDIALKAFALAAQKIPNLRLITFGSDLPAADLPLPPGSEHIYCPPQENIKEIYARCDAWLFASTTEGFGMPILEAMACRTPVIGTPAGAAPELLSEGAGILVKPQDPEDMARAIEQVYQMSEENWRVMSDAAYTRATGYTWEDATQLFEAALSTAIQRAKQGDLENEALFFNGTRLQVRN